MAKKEREYTYKKVYTPEVILEGIDYEIPRTYVAIADKCGCSARTVGRCITTLAEEGKVKTIVTEIGSDRKIVGWLRVREG
jgi:DNA-binding Lrp family transcriptional regulator